MIDPHAPVLLVGIDGSDTSLRAGAYAGGLATRQHARLVCLYVRTYKIAAGVGVAAIPSMQQAHDDIAGELREMVETQSARHRAPRRVRRARGQPVQRRSSGWPTSCPPTR